MFNTAQEIIFDRYKHPVHAGNLDSPTLKAEGSNPLCGDVVTMEATLNDSVITAIKHQTRACAICTASADILAEELLGKTMAQVNEVTGEEIQALLDIPLSPLRLKCALLPLETLKKAQV